jgi:hypothetical protein
MEKSVFVPAVHDSIGSLFLAVVMMTAIQSMHDAFVMMFRIQSMIPLL